LIVVLDPAYAKVIVLVALCALALIRGMHTVRRPETTIATRHEGWRELFVLVAVVAGFLIPIAWAMTPWLAFADVTPHALPVVSGAMVLAASLYLFHRTHADLGANWSARLQIVDAHQLITAGIYRRVRHPMYLALLLYGLGQMLAVPNWIAGPCGLLGAVLLAAMRIGPEEAMMRERFGREYDAYMIGTGRILPRFQRRR
jgi:protein-S-isoprenylcysteine O-methyltransferase Ste14